MSFLKPLKLFVHPLLMLALYLPLTVHAEVYKWVDDHGNVSFSQFPPTDRKSAPIQIHWTEPALSKAAPKELEQAKKDAADKKDEKLKGSSFYTVDNDKAQKACIDAKKRLKQLENPRARILKKNKDGNPVTASDDDKKEMKAAEQKIIDQLCK